MNTLTKNKLARFLQNSRLSLFAATGTAVVVVLTGYFLAQTIASGFFASLESEQGTASGNAQIVADSTASGGKAVQFNAPSVGGGSGGGCSATAKNTLGGPDPWGTCWPGPANTGYPHGLPGDTRKAVTLTDYTGPCIITTDGATIDSKTINCNPLEIQAKGVVVQNSKLNGQLYINSDAQVTQYNLNYSVTLKDSEVNVGMVEEPAVFEGAMQLIRDDIHGGVTAVQCGDKAAQCIIQDSYLHGELIQQKTTWHLGAFHSIGGTNYTLTHNYVACDQTYTYETATDSGGCSGDIVFIPNDSTLPISNANVTKNFLAANASNAFCLYGGNRGSTIGTYMNFTDNVFQKSNLPNGCAAYGPVTAFSVGGTGNQWVRNVWDTGGDVAPAE